MTGTISLKLFLTGSDLREEYNLYPFIHIVLPSYSVLALIGGFLSMIIIYFRIEEYRITFTDYLKMFGVCVVFGFVGSRVLFVISRIPWLIDNFTIINLLSNIIGGGFVFYGGLFGVLLGIKLYSSKKGYNVDHIYNMITPAIPLFHFFGRIGCFLAGCCYGFSFSEPVKILGFITMNNFPTQLVEAIFELVLFIGLLFIQKKNIQINYLNSYLCIYAVFRFMIEFTRGDDLRGYFFGISTSQWVSIIIIISIIISLIKKRRKVSL